MHGEEGKEKDEELRERQKEKSSNSERNAHHGWYGDGMTDSRDDLSQCGCDISVRRTRHLTACRRAQTYMLRMCLSVYVVSLLSLSTLVLMRLLSLCTFA